MGGVPRTATEAQLTALAAELGAVHSATLLKDPQNAAQNRGRAAAPFPVTARLLALALGNQALDLASACWAARTPR